MHTLHIMSPLPHRYLYLHASSLQVPITLLIIDPYIPVIIGVLLAPSENWSDRFSRIRSCRPTSYSIELCVKSIFNTHWRKCVVRMVFHSLNNPPNNRASPIKTNDSDHGQNWTVRDLRVNCYYWRIWGGTLETFLSQVKLSNLMR